MDENGGNARSASCKWSDASTVSFHPVKHICCGEGGAALFTSEEIAHKAERLLSRNYERH